MINFQLQKHFSFFNKILFDPPRWLSTFSRGTQVLLSQYKRDFKKPPTACITYLSLTNSDQPELFFNLGDR